jgi:hypothetical protein
MKKAIVLISIALFVFIIILPQMNLANRERGMDEKSIFDTMISCPSWELSNSEKDCALIISKLMKIANCDIDLLRSAMKHYIEECNKGENKSLSLDNMMILNRLIFSVPEKMTLDEINKMPFFMGGARPREGKCVLMLWPLKFNATGRLVIDGSGYSISGNSMDPLSEFDAFSKVFKRRKSK